MEPPRFDAQLHSTAHHTLEVVTGQFRGYGVEDRTRNRGQGEDRGQYHLAKQALSVVDHISYLIYQHGSMNHVTDSATT
jgi:hypothetical protein